MSLASVTAGSALWYLARGSGLVTLLLFTGSLALGILTSKRWKAGPVPRFVTGDLHRNLSLLSLSFLAIHIASVVIDGFAPIGWISAVVPFSTPYRPLWLGLGAVATDLMLALAITSGLRRRMPYKVWHGIHLAAYACWPIAVMHALGSGTDATRPWTIAILATSAAAVLGLSAWRLLSTPSLSRSARALASAGAFFSPVLITGWAVNGPLQTGWARRAGTPPAVLAKVYSASATTSPSAATGSTTRPVATPASFSADLAGQLTQTGDLVQVTAQLSGEASGTVSISLRGRQLAGGGVELADGSVDVALSDGRRLTGKVTDLAGSRIGATLTDLQGRTTPATIELAINADNSVQGRMAVGQSARRAEHGGEGQEQEGH